MHQPPQARKTKPQRPKVALFISNYGPLRGLRMMDERLAWSLHCLLRVDLVVDERASLDWAGQLKAGAGQAFMW
jgi:hypothetical protein